MCQLFRVVTEPVDTDEETREDVCLDCHYSRKSDPITCRLISRKRSGVVSPCPHILAIRLATPDAACPNPDKEWSARWKAAAVKPVRKEVVIELNRQLAGPNAGRKDRARPNLARRGIMKRPMLIGPVHAR